MSRGRDEVHEFRVGRIKHERVKVPRGEKLLEWAIQVPTLNCKENLLEVEFTTLSNIFLINKLRFCSPYSIAKLFHALIFLFH